MNKLSLKAFKAHRDLSIDFNDKNFLLYGDNGAGKSSIYEAIKVVFFKDKLSQNIPTANTPEETTQNETDFWSKYNNKNSGNDFQLEINENDYKEFDSSNYQLFMLSLDELLINQSIKLDNLLERFYFPTFDINSFCNTNYKSIESSVNESLLAFRENIQIVIDEEDDYTIKIVDDIKQIESKVEIKKYFNEAKLNLVLLLLIFASIKILGRSDKKKILVLDDFITSLDVSNRTFLMRYLFDNFSEFQLVIFTHNVYFYNLIMYLIKDIYTRDNRLKKEKWNLANIYEINNEHKYYVKGSINRVKDIRDSYNATNIEDTGNKIRQRFEVLLYEFSKLLMIGAVEDNKKILERIDNSQNIYFKEIGKKTASDLLDEVEELLAQDNPPNLQTRLREKINPYRQSGFRDIQKVIKNLKLYQKVTLHPMSHGTIGQSSFTTNEIEESLDLLEKFETYIKDLIDSDVDGA